MALIVKKSGETRIVHNWPVVVPTALDDGNIRKDEIRVDYEVLPQSEIDDITRTAQQAGQSGDSALLRRSVKSISGEVDENNNPIPFNEDTFTEALDRSNQRMAMTNAFFDVQAGRKAARKN